MVPKSFILLYAILGRSKIMKNTSLTSKIEYQKEKIFIIIGKL